MKVIDVNKLKGTDREVLCPKEGFISNRILLDSDKMGYTLTKTIIPKGEKQFWHYKNHLETCYCVWGEGVLTDALTGEEHKITADITYVLDKNDPHYFQAKTDMMLICVFNPPLKNGEVHQEDGSYAT